MIETNKREGIYSFIHTPLLTVAIHVFSAQHHNRTADPFSAHMVFLSFSTPPSSLLAADSDHKKDFYAHPLAAAIDVAKPGNRLGDISNTIGDVAREYGYPINLEFGGHGVGHIMHGDPHVPNDGRAHHGYKLREGLVIAIEPWFLKTTDEIFQDPKDGWTLRASDGSRGAHSEHTIAITENGPIVFTDRTNL